MVDSDRDSDCDKKEQAVTHGLVQPSCPEGVSERKRQREGKRRRGGGRAEESVPRVDPEKLSEETSLGMSAVITQPRTVRVGLGKVRSGQVVVLKQVQASTQTTS